MALAIELAFGAPRFTAAATVLRGVALAALAAAIAYAWRHRPLVGVGRAFRVGVVVAVLAVALTSLARAGDWFGADRAVDKYVLHSCAALAIAAWLWGASRRRGDPARPGLGTILAVNGALALVAAEVTLVLASRLFPSPLLWSPHSAESVLDAARFAPGRRLFGMPVNRGGYHDEEFFRPGPRDLVVAVLADSFGVGVVPHAYNFTTVAERELATSMPGRFERIALHNFGVSATGLREHAFLLHTEVLRHDPAHVVLAVFIGNDIHQNEPLYEHTKARMRSTFQDWLVFRFVRRVTRLLDEGITAGGRVAAATIGADATGFDPTQEEPHVSEPVFLRIERERLPVCEVGARADAMLARFVAEIAAFHEWLGDRLLVVLIPDEYQVNDALWRQLMAGTARTTTFDREQPQSRIMAYCAERGIRAIDALPALRRAERDAATYHLRDTHLNAHGNAVLGRILAAALRDVIDGD